ncbi:MAG: PLP-dependent cysteine synthase family protein [Ostreibacterium sp.]
MKNTTFSSECCKTWTCQAVDKITADFNRSSDTHLIKLDLPFFDSVNLYLKDESTHPTGSLKHRLARSLFLYGICNGKITENTVIIEASSGSTAISEAYFARLLGLKFIAVVPETTVQEKLDLIAFYGGQCVKVKSNEIYAQSERLASELGGYYMDQFTYAERATDWRSNNNIAESIFKQMQCEIHPIPDWVVVGAGTGGTSATIGRFIRYNPELFCRTKLCVVDVENSVFYPYYQSRDKTLTSSIGSRIEGIGRPRVEASFNPDIIDKMHVVPDAASIATIHWFEKILGRKVGASTGTNLYAAFQLMQEMSNAGKSGSIVTLLCDSGERYLDSYYNDDWLLEKGIRIAPYIDELNALAEN